VPFEASLVLLGDDDAIAEAQRMLARIGYDRPRPATTDEAAGSRPRTRAVAAVGRFATSTRTPAGRA
jgi:hypothetical protein